MAVTFTAADRVGSIGGYIGGISSLLGMLGAGAAAAPVAAQSGYMTKDEAYLMRDNAAKDAEIALLKADQASEVKMTEVYRQSHDELVALRDKVEALKDKQTQINTDQAVWNGVMSADLACQKGRIDQLYGLTSLKIPGTSVCMGNLLSGGTTAT